MKCSVCPHRCVIEKYEVGKCNIYSNQDGKIFNLYKGRISTMSVDSIEKRPFFHFLPGHKTLAIGYYGCNLVCSFCQNFKISQNIGDKFLDITAEDIVKKCLDRDIRCISFTYNEPLMYYEDIIQIAELAKKNNIKIAVKTNGFISSMVWDAVSPLIDAVNIDIKGDDLEYQRICGGKLKPVLSIVELAHKTSVHLEISYLVLPRLIDDFGFHIEIAEFLRVLDVNIPIHVLYYIPFHEMQESSYSNAEYLKVIELMKKYMNYVYASNRYGDFWNQHRSTSCKQCNYTYIDRKGSGTINDIACSCGKEFYGIIE